MFFRKYPRFKVFRETRYNREKMYIQLRKGTYAYSDNVEPQHGVFVEVDLDHEDNVLGITITVQETTNNKDLV